MLYLQSWEGLKGKSANASAQNDSGPLSSQRIVTYLHGCHFISRNLLGKGKMASAEDHP